jgi:hypothetical protein
MSLQRVMERMLDGRLSGLGVQISTTEAVLSNVRQAGLQQLRPRD